MNEELRTNLNALLDGLEKAGATGAQIALVQQSMLDMASSMAAVAMALEKPPQWASELVAAIKGLTIVMPEINLPAPIVNMPAPSITVQPAQVTLPPAPSHAAQMPLMPSGLRVKVAKRDDLGRVAEYLFIPEN